MRRSTLPSPRPLQRVATAIVFKTCTMQVVDISQRTYRKPGCRCEEACTADFEVASFADGAVPVPRPLQRVAPCSISACTWSSGKRRPSVWSIGTHAQARNRGRAASASTEKRTPLALSHRASIPNATLYFADPAPLAAHCNCNTTISHAWRQECCAGCGVHLVSTQAHTESRGADYKKCALQQCHIHVPDKTGSILESMYTHAQTRRSVRHWF